MKHTIKHYALLGLTITTLLGTDSAYAATISVKTAQSWLNQEHQAVATAESKLLAILHKETRPTNLQDDAQASINQLTKQEITELNDAIDALAAGKKISQFSSNRVKTIFNSIATSANTINKTGFKIKPGEHLKNRTENFLKHARGIVDLFGPTAAATTKK